MAQPPQEPQEPAQGLTVTSLEELYKLTKAQFTIVTSIALPNRSLNDVENLEEFFKCLAQCTDLRKLDLRYNNLGPEGAKALAPVLGKLIQLQYLDLHCNDLGPEGAKALEPVLAELRELQHLDLHSNDLAQKGQTP